MAKNTMIIVRAMDPGGNTPGNMLFVKSNIRAASFTATFDVDGDGVPVLSDDKTFRIAAPDTEVESLTARLRDICRVGIIRTESEE